MNVLELFAGIGGMGLGLERTGMTVVGQVEIDPFARSILDKHWPEVPKHDDVRTTVAWWRSAARPYVDVIAGGYPCQGESLAGKRRGTDDARWLWPDMARVIHALRPRYVIGENVLGHRTGGLRFVLRDLERLGYTARSGIVAASEVGAPHRRQRIFTIGELADTECEPRDAWRVGDSGESTGRRDSDRGGVRPDGLANAGGERRGSGRSKRGMEAGQPAIVTRGAGTVAVGSSWWAVEPPIRRVAYGVPGRVDRLRTLGNAVVPQVAEFVGRLLLSGDWLSH